MMVADLIPVTGTVWAARCDHRKARCLHHLGAELDDVYAQTVRHQRVQCWRRDPSAAVLYPMVARGGAISSADEHEGYLGLSEGEQPNHTEHKRQLAERIQRSVLPNRNGATS